MPVRTAAMPTVGGNAGRLTTDKPKTIPEAAIAERINPGMSMGADVPEAISGAVLLGKTNTPHIGYKDMTDNLLGPPCRNPWNLARSAGGSSGGSAAAVAAGAVAVAHGSDATG